MSRSVYVHVTANGQAVALSGRVAEAVLALAVTLASREERLNGTWAWSAEISCGERDVKIGVRETVKPHAFCSSLEVGP